MASSIASELVLQAAAWTTAVFALAASMVVAWVAVERARNTRFRARRVAAEQRWRLLLAACIDAPDPLELPAPQAGERGALLSVWADYHELLSGSGASDLNRAARVLGIRALAEQMLRGRSLRNRVIALLTLGHLGEADAEPLLRGHLQDRDARVSLAAARALVQVDPERGLGRVLEIAAARGDWPTPRLAQLLRDVDRHTACAALEAQLPMLDAAALPPFLKLLARIGCDDRLDAIRGVLARFPDDQELLRAALDALDDPRALVIVRGAAGHADWRVRAAAARALGRLGSGGNALLLEGLLTDSQWWVRWRAAQALVTLPGMDAHRLRALRGRLGDRYARDMLDEVTGGALRT